MSVAAVVGAALSHIYLLFYALAVIVWWRTMRRARSEHRALDSAFVFWGELLFWYGGLTLIWAGFFHGYEQSIAARSIGWQPSPFEYELGWFEIGIGIAALFARRQNYGYRLALTIPIVVFSFAAAAQHIALMLTKHNFAPNNAGMMLWLNDIIMPLILAWVAFAARDAGR